MEDNLLLCLQDKTANIRTQAEDMLKFSLNYIKLNNYYDKIKQYKPAIANDLQIILDKIQTEVYGDNSNDINNNKNNEINNEKNDDKKNIEDDIDNEGNININELILINSNSKSSSNKKKSYGASSHKNRQRDK